MPEPASRLKEVRGVVRSMLESTPRYRELDPERRATLARSMVRLGDVALSLMAEEDEAARELVAPDETDPGGINPDGINSDWIGPEAAGVDEAFAGPTGAYPNGAHPMGEYASDAALGAAGFEEPPYAVAQAGGVQRFDPRANRQLADVAADTLSQVSFPRFVTELITGVFKAITDSNAKQMQSYVDLISGVAASAEGMDGNALGPVAARSWLMQRFPDSYELASGGSTDIWGESKDSGPVLRLRDGADAPNEEALRTALELDDSASVSGDDPEEGLVALARGYLSRKRGAVLGTMIMMGLQRLVVEHGRITAGMRFHIDARSAAEEDRASRFEFSHSSSGSANVGIGAWGASASMTNTIGYVKTQRSSESEEMNQGLDLNSNVELHFRNDFIPLNTVANEKQVERIKGASLNPKAFESATTPAAEAAKTAAARRAEMGKVTGTTIVKQPTAPTAPTGPDAKKPTAEKKPPPTKTPPAAKTPPAKTPPAAKAPATKTPTTGTTAPAAKTPPPKTTPAPVSRS